MAGISDSGGWVCVSLETRDLVVDSRLLFFVFVGWLTATQGFLDFGFCCNVGSRVPGDVGFGCLGGGLR